MNKTNDSANMKVGAKKTATAHTPTVSRYQDRLILNSL